MGDTKAVLDTRPADAYISANRTCEMGLLHATGRPYQSFVFLLEELGRPETRIEIGQSVTPKT
jgi:D-lactate dehydrogenase